MRKRRHLRHLRQREKTRTNTIVYVVSVVGNGIGQVAQLCFQAGLGGIHKSVCHAARLLRLQHQGVARAAMLQNALARFKAKIQTIKFWVALF